MGSVDVSGPLFTGAADRELDALVHEAVVELSAIASESVHQTLDRSIRHPTPYYETQVTTEYPDPTTGVTHDRGIVYGPWLEGIDDRNKTTRFKGYHAFQTAREKVQRETPRVLSHVAHKFIARIT